MRQFFVAVAISIAFLATPALAEKRIALVIGNSAYVNIPQLDNPKNDARLMADTLRALGFTLVGGRAQVDLEKSGFDHVVQDFGNQLSGADIALFYYAGHGLQVRGANYLVPIGANPTKEADVDFQLFDVGVVLRQMESSGTRLNLVILDACRNNPFGGRGLRAAEGGLAQIRAPEGTMISFATQPGNVAQDGVDGNSPYTKALAATIRKPGLGIFEVFNEVGLLVKRTTGGAQQPWVSSSPIDGSFYFAGLPSAKGPPSPAVAPSPAADEIAWGFLKSTTDVAALRQFLAEYPVSRHKDEALARIAEIEREKIAVLTPPADRVTTPDVAVKPSARPPHDDSGRTIKVGILHSLSGAMAASETTLKDVMLMLINEQNKKGGLLGKELEAVVVDPASNWPRFAEKARELIVNDKVAVVFGCWTSISRKLVLPVFKELNSILFYPVQYEGEESERNVFYTGATPNQQALPAVDYLMSEAKVKRWVLEGTDFVYPHTANQIIEAYLTSKGVKQEDIMINYTPFGFSDWRAEVSKIKKFGSIGKVTAVVSTINGNANVSFYQEFGKQGIKANDIPVVALSVGEQELVGVNARPLVGHLAAWNYFQSIKTAENAAFIREWQSYIKNPKGPTDDPMEAHFIGFKMWVKAVEKANSTNPDKVIGALPGIEVPNLSGGISRMLPNHHITKPVFVGVVRADGQFDLLWKSPVPVPGDAWSDYLPGSKDLEADWVKLECGNYNTVTRTCGN